MKLDLAALAGQLTAAKGKVRVNWSGGKIDIDEQGFIGRVADALATVMGANLYRGLRTDGSGPMPGRKKDGTPRGKGSAIARAIAALPSGPGEWFLTAHREIPGHLMRIFQEVDFKPPPLERIRMAVIKAFERSVKVGAFGGVLRQGNVMGKALRWGVSGGGPRPVKLGKFTGKSDWAGFGDTRSKIAKAIRPKQVRHQPLERALRGRGPRKSGG